jgi:hypothetical protein
VRILGRETRGSRNWGPLGNVLGRGFLNFAQFNLRSLAQQPASQRKFKKFIVENLFNGRADILDQKKLGKEEFTFSRVARA